MIAGTINVGISCSEKLNKQPDKTREWEQRDDTQLFKRSRRGRGTTEEQQPVSNNDIVEGGILPCLNHQPLKEVLTTVITDLFWLNESCICFYFALCKMFFHRIFRLKQLIRIKSTFRVTGALMMYVCKFYGLR